MLNILFQIYLEQTVNSVWTIGTRKQQNRTIFSKKNVEVSCIPLKNIFADKKIKYENYGGQLLK